MPYRPLKTVTAIIVLLFVLFLTACESMSPFVQYLLDPDSEWPREEEQQLTDADIAAARAREQAGLPEQPAIPLATLFEDDPIAEREREWVWAGGVVPYETLNAVTVGDQGFVAVGTHGLVAHSSDGEQWSYVELDVEAHFYDVVHANGVFIAGGGGLGEPIMAVSPDGVTWYRTRLPGEVREYEAYNWIESITFTGGRLLATTSGGENPPFGGGGATPRVPRNSDGYHISSLNGVLWSLNGAYDTPVTPMASNGTGTVVSPTRYSADHGLTWRSHENPPWGNSLWSVAHWDSPGRRWIVSVGSDFYTSGDGTTWNELDAWGLRISLQGRTSAVLATDERLFVSSAEDAVSSSRPQLYHSVESDDFDFDTLADFDPYGSIRSMASNGEVVVGVGDNGILDTYDIATLVRIAGQDRPLEANGLAAVGASDENVLFGGGHPVIGTRLWFGTSIDGLNWERTEFEMADGSDSFISELSIVEWDEDRPIVVGFSVGMEEAPGLLAKGSDGLWYTHLFNDDFPRSFSAVATIGGTSVITAPRFGPWGDGGTSVATFPAGSPGMAGADRTYTLENMTIRDATVFRDRLIAVGDDGLVAGTRNGTDWNRLPAPTDRRLRHVASGDGVIVTIAQSAQDDDESTFFVSEDAMEWEEHTLPTNVFGSVSRLEYTNGGFLAWVATDTSAPGSATTVFTSDDGRVWTQDAVTGQVSVVYRTADGRLVAGGRTGLLLERR